MIKIERRYVIIKRKKSMKLDQEKKKKKVSSASFPSGLSFSKEQVSLCVQP
jgi:hypothetical protein